MTWQPIETAPKDGTRVLAFWEPDLICLGFFNSSGEWFDDDIDGEPWKRNPTHWMPLPEPPKDLEDAG